MAKEKYVKNYFSKNMPVFATVLLALVLGVLAGAFMAARLPEEDAARLSAEVTQNIVSATAATSFSKALGQNVKNTLALWILGMTVIGAPLLLAVVGMRGYAVGYTVGFLVRSYGLTGFLASAAGVLPHNLLVLPCYVLLAGFGICFSKTLLKGGREMRGMLVSYTLRTALVFAVVFSATLLEGYVSCNLLKTAMGIIINQG